MVSIVEGLPAVMGSLAALVVGFISLAVDAPLGVFGTRVAAAFIVFWAFGLVIRATMADAARAAHAAQSTPPSAGIPVIPPGTPVSALLREESGGEG